MRGEKGEGRRGREGAETLQEYREATKRMSGAIARISGSHCANIGKPSHSIGRHCVLSVAIAIIRVAPCLCQLIDSSNPLPPPSPAYYESGFRMMVNCDIVDSNIKASKREQMVRRQLGYQEQIGDGDGDYGEPCFGITFTSYGMVQSGILEPTQYGSVVCDGSDVGGDEGGYWGMVFFDEVSTMKGRVEPVF